MLMKPAYRSLPAVLAILVPGLALAEVDTSQWLCESCPFEKGYRAEYNAGASYVSNDAARFGNGSGYDEKGAYANVDGNGNFAKDAYRLNWTLSNLGLSSRAFEIDARYCPQLAHRPA